MPADVVWTMRLYNRRTGSELTAQPLAAINRKLTLTLNGFDQLDFSLWLDDGDASLIKDDGSVVVKLWRDIVRPGYTFSNPIAFPIFAGVVGARERRGADNVVNVTAYSPLWLLLFRFHLLNHRLVKNNLSGTSNPDGQIGGSGVGSTWDQSALMWKIIDLINGAFGVAYGSPSDTGIRMGTWPKTVTMSPYFIAKGSWSWPHIDEILNKPDSVDLFPLYLHVPNDMKLMYFSTAIKRGDDRSADVSFNYHTGPAGARTDNCDDMVERSVLVPGRYADYVWAVGQGGPNAAAVAATQDTTLLNTNGVFMRREDIDHPMSIAEAGNQSQNFLALSRVPARGYEVVMSSTVPPYYYKNFFLGDVVSLNAAKGAFVLDNLKQRIYQVELAMSENNVEQPRIWLAHDFNSRVAETI